MLTPDSNGQKDELTQHPELPTNLQLIEDPLPVVQIPPFIPHQPIAQIAPIIMAAQPQKKFCVPLHFLERMTKMVLIGYSDTKTLEGTIAGVNLSCYKILVATLRGHAGNGSDA